MALSGNQLTRLSPTAVPTQVTGSFDDKTGGAAEAVAARPQRGGFGGRDVGLGAADVDEQRRIADELRALYYGVYEDVAAEPDSEAAEKVATATIDYVPTSAPDIPAPDQVDWEAIVEDGRARIMQMRVMLREVRSLLRDDVQRQEDDAVFLLLME